MATVMPAISDCKQQQDVGCGNTNFAECVYRSESTQAGLDAGCRSVATTSSSSSSSPPGLNATIALFTHYDRNGTGMIERWVLTKILGLLDPEQPGKFEEIITDFMLEEERKAQRVGGASAKGGALIDYAAFFRWLWRDNWLPATAAKKKEKEEENGIAKPSGGPSLRNNNSSGHRDEDDAIVDSIEGLSVEYITDVEGNWDYFLRFVDMSSILYWEKKPELPATLGTLSIHRHGILVFGGDATDKGPGDIRFVKALMSLKKAFPRQVFIILGNRDIQYMRYFSEMTPLGLQNPFVPYWLQGEKLVTFDKYLEAGEATKPRTLETMMHWMQEKNMGCQTTFETRRQELALLKGKATAEEVSEEEVVASFRDAVDPDSNDPWMLELLRAGRLAVILGDALFVHAGLRDSSLGYVPGKEGVKMESVRSWVQELNAWKDDQISDFERRGAWRCSNEEGARRRGGAMLMDYGVPGGAKNASIVYYNPLKDGDPKLLSDSVQETLLKSGIRRVFSGHQPHGQSPAVVRHPKTGVLTIACDTSYSDMSASKADNISDNRGAAVSVVRIAAASVHVYGVLSDGKTHHAYVVHTDSQADTMPNALVGRKLKDGSWVKTVLQTSFLDPKVQAVKASGNYSLIVNDVSARAASTQLEEEHVPATVAAMLATGKPTEGQ